jgi:hypothetical protein
MSRSMSRADATVVLVEEIPTGHTTLMTIEVETIEIDLGPECRSRPRHSYRRQVASRRMASRTGRAV